MMNKYVHVISNGNRVCYFNIGQTKTLKPFLRINSIDSEKPNTKSCLRIFDNEIEQFSLGFMRIMVKSKVAIPSNDKSICFWTKNDKALLEVGYAMGRRVEVLATELNRTVEEVEQQIEILRLKEKYIV